MLSAPASPVAESIKSRESKEQSALDKIDGKTEVTQGEKLKESPEEGDSNHRLTLGKITVTGGLTSSRYGKSCNSTSRH